MAEMSTRGAEFSPWAENLEAWSCCTSVLPQTRQCSAQQLLADTKPESVPNKLAFITSSQLAYHYMVAAG